MKKRLLALFLALTLFINVPVTPAFAVEPEQKASIFGVEKQGNNLVVSWYGDDVHTVVAQVYTYTISGEQAEYKLQEEARAAGDPAAQAEVQTTCAFGALPDPVSEGFFVKSWLEDQSGRCISEVYEDSTYTREMQEVLNQTADDYPNAIDLSPKYGAGSFVALKPGVELVDVTMTNMTKVGNDYTFTGVKPTLQSTLTPLPGDTLVCLVHHDENGLRDVLGVTADQLSITGGTMHVTGERMTVDKYADASRFGTTKFDFTFKPNYDNLYYTISSTVTITITIGFAHKGSSVSFTLASDFLAKDTSLTVKSTTIGVTETLFSIPIGELPPFGHVDFDYNLELYGTGMCSFVFDLTGALGFQVGVSLQHGIQFNNLSKMPKFEFQGVNLDGEIFVGMGVGPNLSVADVLSLSLEMCAGMIIHGNFTSIEYKDDKKRWHACKPMECFHGDLKARVFFSGIVTFLKYLSRSINLNIIETPEFATFYSSITFGDSNRKTDCPHFGYRLEVIVWDTEDNLIEGATVSLWPAEEHYESKASAVTNKNGVATLYLPELQKTIIGVDYPDDKGNIIHAELPFTEYGYREDTTDLIDPSVTIIIDRREYKIHFADSRTSTSTSPIHNLPEPNPMVYYKGTGEPVYLPTTIPTKSGLQFIGWTDAPWGTTVEFLPGQEVDFDKDETMYALWKIAGNVYYILYDAGGGTGAPHAEVHEKDDLVEVKLSDQVPERIGWKFMGWERHDDPTILLQPGQVVYTSDATSDERVTLQLKARWEMDTFGIYTIEYNLNHAPGHPPKAQTVKTGESARVTSEIFAWDDQHLFQGWSENPLAFLPSHYPGLTYRFDKDTTLYAIWDTDYRIIYGMGSTWPRGSEWPLRFIGNGNAQYFEDVIIDGKPLLSANFQQTSGSTIIDLQPAYLSKLPLGEHTIQLRYRDGVTDVANFIIADPPPKTGDNSHPEYWCLMMVVALGGMLIVRKKKKA